MNTILLQKILDILREGLAHVGDFFKDLFVSDPQDGQVIGYDADAGKWKNMSIAELSLDVTDTAGPDVIITFSDAAAMPLKSLVANINATGGTTEVNITHTGKNLFNGTVYQANKYISDNNGTISSSNNFDIYKFDINGSGKTMYLSTYFDSATTFQAVRVSKYAADDTILTTVGTVLSPNADNSLEITTSANVKYILISLRKECKNVQLELGTSATAYEAYTGATETITLPSSVTSGYVDVISGQGMSGDTPFTVTPVIINSTLGINNIFADTGDVKAVYYTKAAGDIKSLVCITDDITSEITKNTTDFSDILLKVSQNNKAVSIEIYSATTSAAVNETFLSGLPKPAMNSKVLLVNTTLGEDGTILGTLKASGELEIATSGAKTFSGLITYVAK